MARMKPSIPDLSEKGAPAKKGGKQQSTDRRLFMQLLVFSECKRSELLVDAVKHAGFPCVLYEQLNDPRGVGLLTWHEDPDHFTMTTRYLVNSGPFAELELKEEFSMFGRTYSIGHEHNLQHWLIDKPVHTVLNRDWPWAVWYPLRRAGAFAALTPAQQGKILKEHAEIGMNFAAGDYAHDVRLACQGLDCNDNDFVIGLLGKDLYPLSAVVQSMRKTKQTSEYLESLGPFFVGKAVYQTHE